MAAHVTDSILFQHIFSTPELREIFSDENLIQNWLDVESALARVEARLGIIPEGAAEEIANRAHLEHLRLVELKEQIGATGQIIVPVVQALSAVCDGEAGEYVHWGATTQDITDTGMVLQLKQAYAVFLRDLEKIRDVLVELAWEHRTTPMAGRTYSQHALPITFGYKVAVWLAEVSRNIDRLRGSEERVLVGQFAGATGTLSSLGLDGLRVQRALMDELGLGTPEIAWHAARDRVAELVSILCMIATTQSKIAREIISLQKTELDEAREPVEPGSVGSSTMPHKRNPMVCEGIISVARQVRSTLIPAYEGMIQEHERGSWWAEWAYVPEACMMTGAVLRNSLYVLENLDVNPQAMSRNLQITQGWIMSEAVMYELSENIGRQTAHELLLELARESRTKGVPFSDALRQHSVASRVLPEKRVEELLDPRTYLGLSTEFVDKVIGKVIDREAQGPDDRIGGTDL